MCAVGRRNLSVGDSPTWQLSLPPVANGEIAELTISTWYFDEGAIISGTAYYYLTDELGSVTELVSSSGRTASQFTYDP